ncbi:hypothetical protein LTS16_025174 [Friedmanniomyces endolithicus]|nr:hypothetical protein LTS16_025174 [Friedmanniomyces endolithicus]
MGTLTAHQSRLPGQCPHKLPTSCRLTSLPTCCACADERPHSAAYSTYVDGVGFVPWGTRWQRYCWYCREFWTKRVAVSGLRAESTRVPGLPDQGEFLERWEECHRGFRTVLLEGGGEERVEVVLGEEWREVDPGCLPRTLEEMRAGREASEVVARPVVEVEVREEVGAGQTLEDTLDQMFQEADSEDTVARSATQAGVTNARFRGEPPADSAHTASVVRGGRDAQPARNNIHAQAMVPAASRNRDYQLRRIAALRRELHRMRNGIERVMSGLRDLGEAVPEHAEATNRLTALGSTLDEIGGVSSREVDDLPIRSANEPATNAPTSQNDRTAANMQARVDEARQHLDEARRNREQAVSELDVAEQDFRTSQQSVQQLQREQRTTENYIRLFGTREEMLAQGDQYESPIGGMFSRAYQRFHAAEEVRRDERTLRRVLEDEARAGGEEEAGRLAELETRERDVWGVPLLHEVSRPGDSDERGIAQEPEGELNEYYALLRRQNWSQRPAVENSQAMPSTLNAELGENGMSPEAEAVSTAVPTRGLEPSEGFPQSMLNGVASLRAQQVAQPEQETSTEAFVAERELEADARHVLDYLQRFPELLQHITYTPGDLARVHARLGTHALTPQDWAVIYTLLIIPAIVWHSGVMSARFLRQRRLGLPVHLAMPTTTLDWMQQTEAMAEAFQMSGEVRQRAHGMTGPERLSMLYRLQAGERTLDDVGKLQQMLWDRTTLRTAIRVHAGSAASTDDRAQAEATALAARQQRQEAARVGDHSRQELNAQRQAARAMAIAAGRTAMQTGPDALLQQMARSDAETQAAYERLRENDWTPDGNTDAERRLRRTIYTPFGTHELASPSDSETEQEDGDDTDEPAGLDAEGFGRPEPRADEELKVNLECRICYTQLAEIACLPCGHLVMCKWCSEQHSPVMAHDHTRPMRAAGCPVCRKGVRQKVRVYRA